MPLGQQYRRAKQVSDAFPPISGKAPNVVTDVKSVVSGAGIPMALAYHMFTTLIFSAIVLAEFKVWTYKLHPSATLNIGIVQAWAGLACLSRT